MGEVHAEKTLSQWRLIIHEDNRPTLYDPEGRDLSEEFLSVKVTFYPFAIIRDPFAMQRRSDREVTLQLKSGTFTLDSNEFVMEKRLSQEEADKIRLWHPMEEQS